MAPKLKQEAPFRKRDTFLPKPSGLFFFCEPRPAKSGSREKCCRPLSFTRPYHLLQWRR